MKTRSTRCRGTSSVEMVVAASILGPLLLVALNASEKSVSRLAVSLERPSELRRASARALRSDRS